MAAPATVLTGSVDTAAPTIAPTDAPPIAKLAVFAAVSIVVVVSTAFLLLLSIIFSDFWVHLSFAKIPKS